MPARIPMNALGSHIPIRNILTDETGVGLVADCPFISLGLKAAALRVIVRASNEAKEQPHQYAWVGFNDYSRGSEDERTILMSAHYLARVGFNASPEAETSEVADSLLNYLYSDDMATQQESHLALQKLTLSARPGRLRVPRLLSLSLGTGSL